MSKVILVTGGARSGKSNFAEKLCKDQNNNTAYIATSIPFDDEMKDRVKKHKESRPQNWKTYEIYKDIYTIINDISKEHKTVILDCVTLLVNIPPSKLYVIVYEFFFHLAYNVVFPAMFEYILFIAPPVLLMYCVPAPLVSV